MGESTVYAQTRDQYLRQLSRIDYLAKASLLGVERDKEALIIPLYEKMYRVSPVAIEDMSGAATSFSAQVILAVYVLNATEIVEKKGECLRNFRDFSNSSPLLSYFATNGTGKISRVYSGRTKRLTYGCQQLQGMPVADKLHDVAMMFMALPRVPVYLLFNDKDDLLPASCNLLFASSADQFLDMECLAMIGTVLADRLERVALDYPGDIV